MIYVITGVSRGLGKAIAELYLDEGSSVIGVGRSTSIEHDNFEFVECDLSDLKKVEFLKIKIPEGPVTLINNAGIIGSIKRLSDQNVPDLKSVLDVNVVAPTLLMSAIYNQCSSKNDFVLVNISSGAANRAIPSWAAYCASKAALNMVSETFYLEEGEKGFSPKVYAVSPGVIDTDMQATIRNVESTNFSAQQNFIDLKRNNELYTPAEAAICLNALLKKNFTGEVMQDLRSV